MFLPARGFTQLLEEPNKDGFKHSEMKGHVNQDWVFININTTFTDKDEKTHQRSVLLMFTRPTPIVRSHRTPKLKPTVG